METLAAALAVAGVDRPISVIGTRARIDLLTALNTALTSNPESPDALSSVGFILISKDQKPCFEVYPKRRNPEIGVFAACEQEHEGCDGAPTKMKGVPQYAPRRLHIVPIQSKLASAGYANGSDLGEIDSDIIQQGPFISPTYGACQATTVVHKPHFNRNINIHTGPTQADTLELRFAQLEQELQHRQEQHIRNQDINSHTGPTQNDTLELRVAQLEQELQRRREQHIQYCLRQNQLDFASSNNNARSLLHLSGMASLAHYEKEGPQSPIEVQNNITKTKNAMSKIPNRVSEYDPLSKNEMPEKKRKTTNAVSKGPMAKEKRTVKPSAYILFMTDFFRCLGNHDGKKRGGTMKAAALAWRTLPNEKRKEYERKTTFAIEKWLAGADTEMVGEEHDKLSAQQMSVLVQDPLSASPVDLKEAFQNPTTSTESSSLKKPVSKHAASQASVLDSGKDSSIVPAADTTTDTTSEQQADSKEQKSAIPKSSTVRGVKYRETLRIQPGGEEKRKALQNKNKRRSRLRKKTRKFVEDNLFKRQQFDRIELEEIESRVNIFISWQKRAIRKLKKRQKGTFNKTVDVVDEEIIFDLGHARYESDVIGEMVKVRDLRIKGKEYKPGEQLDKMKEIRKKETEKLLKELHAAASSTTNE